MGNRRLDRGLARSRLQFAGAAMATSWWGPVTVPTDRRYAFRYREEGGRWFNDLEADAYQPNEFGGADEVVDLSSVGPSRR